MQKPTAQPALQLRMAKEVRVVGWQIAGLDPGKEGALWSFCVFFFPCLFYNTIYTSQKCPILLPVTSTAGLQ